MTQIKCDHRELALGEPPAERHPGVDLHEQPDLGFDLAAVQGAEELARVKAVGAERF